MDNFQVARILGLSIQEVEMYGFEWQRGGHPEGYTIIIPDDIPDNIRKKIEKKHGRVSGWISVTKEMIC